MGLYQEDHQHAKVMYSSHQYPHRLVNHPDSVCDDVMITSPCPFVYNTCTEIVNSFPFCATHARSFTRSQTFWQKTAFWQRRRKFVTAGIGCVQRWAATESTTTWPPIAVFSDLNSHKLPCLTLQPVPTSYFLPPVANYCWLRFDTALGVCFTYMTFSACIQECFRKPIVPTHDYMYTVWQLETWLAVLYLARLWVKLMDMFRSTTYCCWGF